MAAIDQEPEPRKEVIYFYRAGIAAINFAQNVYPNPLLYSEVKNALIYMRHNGHKQHADHDPMTLFLTRLAEQLSAHPNALKHPKKALYNAPPILRDIINDWLKTNGYTGLQYQDMDCACGFHNIMSCMDVPCTTCHAHSFPPDKIDTP